MGVEKPTAVPQVIKEAEGVASRRARHLDRIETFEKNKKWFAWGIGAAAFVFLVKLLASEDIGGKDW